MNRSRKGTGVALRCIPMLLGIPRWVGRTCPPSATFDEGMPNGAVRTHALYPGQQFRDPVVVEDGIALLWVGRELQTMDCILWAS